MPRVSRSRTSRHPEVSCNALRGSRNTRELSRNTGEDSCSAEEGFCIAREGDCNAEAASRRSGRLPQRCNRLPQRMGTLPAALREGIERCNPVLSRPGKTPPRCGSSPRGPAARSPRCRKAARDAGTALRRGRRSFCSARNPRGRPGFSPRQLPMTFPRVRRSPRCPGEPPLRCKRDATRSEEPPLPLPAHSLGSAPSKFLCRTVAGFSAPLRS